MHDRDGGGGSEHYHHEDGQGFPDSDGGTVGKRGAIIILAIVAAIFLAVILALVFGLGGPVTVTGG